MKLFLVIAAVLAIAVGAFVVWFGMPKGPSLNEVVHLEQPRITTMPLQKVIQVVAKGNPNTIGKDAFGLVLGTYFKLKGVPKGGPDFKPPRARWPIDESVPVEEWGAKMNEWTGIYAIPVPERITELPEGSEKGNLKAELTSWEYGEVAEILHIGRYADEAPTVTRLKSFIKEHGYEIAGDHEEEYLKGPGMLFAGNPEKYLTMIRYQVRRKEATEEGDTTGVVESDS